MNSSARLDVFQHQRQHLLAIAFRIVASEVDAEDAVQETWIRFAGADVSSVQNVPAWLTTVVTRLCLDILRRRREIRREEPELLADEGQQPEEVVLLADELSAAFVVLLEELTPPQRVALVLHDAFGTPFDEIAHILGTTETSARKMASRGRARVRRVSVPSEQDNERVRKVVQAFLHAARAGDTKRLVQLLDPDVVRLADPQVLPLGGKQRIAGVDAVVAQTLLFRGSAMKAKMATIDGSPGVVVLAGEKVAAALVIRVHADRIVQYDVVADRQRLARLHIEGA